MGATQRMHNKQHFPPAGATHLLGFYSHSARLLIILHQFHGLIASFNEAPRWQFACHSTLFKIAHLRIHCHVNSAFQTSSPGVYKKTIVCAHALSNMGYMTWLRVRDALKIHKTCRNARRAYF